MQLSGRFLDRHETTMLLGAVLAKHSNFKVFNFSDTSEYIPFLQSLITGGESLTLEGNSSTPLTDLASSIKYVYVYNDYPFGSAYWYARNGERGYSNSGFQESLSKDSIAKEYGRTEDFGTMATSDVLDEVQAFYNEHLLPAYNLLGMTPQAKASSFPLKQIGINLNWSQSNLLLAETLLNGSIFVLYKNEVQSVMSLTQFLFGVHKYGVEQHTTVFPELHLLGIPAEHVKAEIRNDLLCNKDTINSFVRTQRKEIANQLDPHKSTLSSIFYTFSENRVQLNGYIKRGDNVYVTFGTCNSDNALRYNATTLGGSLEGFFDKDDAGRASQQLPLFSVFASTAYRWNTPNDTIFFLDEEKLRTAGYYDNKYIEFQVEQDFFDVVNSTYSTINSGISSRKREFKEARNGIISKSTIPDTGKYDFIETGFLFAVMKNSKAKETIKKTQITRAINNTINGFFSWLAHFLIMDEVTLLEKQTTMSILDSYGMGFEKFALANINPKIPISQVIADYKAWHPTLMTSITSKVTTGVTLLYTDPKPSPLSTSEICFSSACSTRTGKEAFQYFGSRIFNQNWLHSNRMNDLLSTNTGDLNCFIFKFSLPASNTNFCDVNAYRAEYVEDPSYEKMGYIIENNAIVSSAGVENIVTQSKGNSRQYTVYRPWGADGSINFRNLFNLSADSLKAFTDLKPCRTFTEYNKWFLDNQDLLKTKVNKLKSESAREMGLNYLSMVETFLSSAASAETPFLPAPVVKVKKGRKKKTAVEETEEVDGETSVEETEAEAPISEETQTLLNKLSIGLGSLGEQNNG